MTSEKVLEAQDTSCHSIWKRSSACADKLGILTTRSIWRESTKGMTTI